MQVKKLKNGITVIFDKRQTESVVIEVQINVGSMQENKKQAGMTHLIEHMLFEGTSTRTAHDISNAIESVGGEFNAATTQERTYYYIYIPKQYFSRAVDILADSIKNSMFDEKVLKKEKNVVLNEIKVINDDPKFYQWIVFFKTLFKNHKAQNPVYGDAEIIKRMTRKDVINYYKKHYIPQNMTISVVGNVKNPFKQIQEKFEQIPSKSIAREKYPAEQLLTNSQKKIVKREVEHSYLVLGYRAAPKGHKDSYALDVIRSILGRGQSSRLFDEIRTKRGIAYIIGALYEASRSFGVFAAYLSATKNHLEEARKVLIDAFQLRNLTKKEVEDAKNYIIGNFILRSEDSKERADLNAEWFLLNRKPRDFIRNIRKVTLNDVIHVAKKYFHKNYAEVLIQK